MNKQIVIWLFFPIAQIDQIGGCELNIMTPTTVTNTCTTCGNLIHEDCDMFKHMKKLLAINVQSAKYLVKKQSSQKLRGKEEEAFRLFPQIMCLLSN